MAPMLAHKTLTLQTPGLCALSAAAAATAAGGSSAPVTIARFEIPSIPNRIVVGPKGTSLGGVSLRVSCGASMVTAAVRLHVAAGFEQLLARGGDILVENGRLDLAGEFMNAIHARVSTSFGVLLSGPNGTGEWLGSCGHESPPLRADTDRRALRFD